MGRFAPTLINRFHAGVVLWFLEVNSYAVLTWKGELRRVHIRLALQYLLT